MSDCIFCNIVNKSIPASLLYEDDTVIAFEDIAPKAPTHQLIIPREHIETVNDLTDGHESLVGHMFTVAKQLAVKQGIADNGYRLVMNCNKDAGQEVFHIHLHLLGGMKLGWPPF